MAQVNDSGMHVFRGTIWNLTGMVVPLVLAVVCIPYLIKGMGSDRFGLLTIAWVVMGYFSFFDFGLGRATTKYVSEIFGRSNEKNLREVIWSSLSAHLCLGLLGGVLLFALAEPLAVFILNIPESLHTEVRQTFYLLAISVPLVVVTAAFRGLLEAINRFDLVNIVKIPSSIVNYIGPLVVITCITPTLTPVVMIIVVGRATVLVCYIFFCRRLFPSIKEKPVFTVPVVKHMLQYGGWLTITNMVSTILTSLDRFMIGAIISTAAVAYYATPYEVVTKLWLFSASLLAVLFPKFTAMNVDRRQEIPALYMRAVYVLLALVAPFVALFLTFGHDLMAIWIDADFATSSAPVLKWLSVGVLINVLAQVPSTFMQSTGRADLPAKLQLLELPLYCLGIYIVAPQLGILGVAILWTCRAFVDAAALFVLSDRMLDNTSDDIGELPVMGHLMTACIFLVLFFSIGHFLGHSIGHRSLLTAVLFALLLAWEWRALLSQDDRMWVCHHIKSILGRTIKTKNV